MGDEAATPATEGGATDGSSDAAPDAGATAEGGATATRASGLRRWSVRLLMVVVVLAILASTVAIWSHRALFNTDVWVANVDAVIADPEVTDALATRLTDQIVNGLQLQSRLRNALPDNQKFLAVPLSAGLGQLVDRVTKEVLQSDTFQEYWSKVNRVVHEKLVAFLRGETTYVQLDDGGQVVIDLTPLIGNILNKLQSAAPDIFGQGFTIPVVNVDVAPGEARQKIESSLGIQLPQDFGRFTVFQSDQLEMVQKGVTIFDRLVIVLPIVTVLLMIVMIAVSVHRLRTALALGIALIVSMILTNALFQAVTNQILGIIKGTAAKNGALILFGNLLGELRAITNWVIIVGVVLAVGAFLAGDSKLARLIRRQVGIVVGRIDHATKGDERALPSPEDGTTARAVLWITAHATGLRYAGLAVGIGWLALVSATWGSLIGVLVVIGLYELGLELLAPSSQVVRARQVIDRAGQSAKATLAGGDAGSG
ncbi:MAG: hypothetical protein U0Q07_08900 [Acidimicrobiales bacterium]